MKKIGMIVMSLFLLASFAYGQENAKSPKATVDGKVVKIRYNQPSLRGRKVGKDLAPYGQVWRTGADSTTKITFTKDVQFAGKPVKAGTYALFTIPEANEWTVILNNDWQKWGAYSYDQSKDVLRVKVPAKKTSSPTEVFTIKVDDKQKGGDLVMTWENTSVAVPMTY
jgi:hypothetical protein